MQPSTMSSPRDYDDIESLIREGSEEVSRNHINRAIHKYQKAYEIAKRSGKRDVLVSCACNLGAALLSRGDAEQATEYLEHAARTLEGENTRQTETLTLNGDLLFNLGLAYSMRTEHDAAAQNFDRAAKTFREGGDFKGYADSSQQLGEQNVKLSQPLKAAECFRDSSRGYLKLGRIYLAGKMVLRQAQNLQDGGNNKDSLDLLLNAETLFSQIQNSTTDSGKLAKLLSDVGSLLFQLRSPEHASQWLHQALNITRVMQSSGNADQKLEARILLTLGETCITLGDYTKAVTINREASVLFGKLENKKYRGQCFYQLAEAYRHLGDHHNAEKYYHVAHQTLEDAGLHDFLWQVLEGLADLNYQRRQLDTSITYYKETITHLSEKGAPQSLRHQMVSKLATALEVQRVGVVKAASYKNRVPVLIQPEQNLQAAETNPIGLPDVPTIQSPVYAPLTSTRLSLYSNLDNSVSDYMARLQVPGRKKKRKSKRHGRRRSGSFDKPVTQGVDEYDTETDISLVKGRMSKMGKRASKRGHSSKQRRAEGRSAPKRLLSHIKGLEVDEDGSAAPPVSSVDDSTQVELPSPIRKYPIKKGMNTASFSDSDPSSAVFTPRGRSASQTVMTEGDTGTTSSGSEDDDDSDRDDSDEDEDEDDSLTDVSSEDNGTGSSSEEESGSNSDSSEEELKYLDESPRSMFNNTYEHPSTTEPMYATIKSRKLSSNQDDERLYETLGLNSTASTAVLTSTMPQRPPPSLPIPPELPKGPRPSLAHRNQHQKMPEQAVLSWEGPKYPDSTTMDNLTRGQREMGLYQVARLAQERQSMQSASSMSSATSEAKVPKSRACIVM